MVFSQQYAYRVVKFFGWDEIGPLDLFSFWSTAILVNWVSG